MLNEWPNPGSVDFPGDWKVREKNFLKVSKNKFLMQEIELLIQVGEADVDDWYGSSSIDDYKFTYSADDFINNPQGIDYDMDHPRPHGGPTQYAHTKS